MCTVTYIPFRDKVFITSNRDEQSRRLPALAPAIYETPGGRLLYPRDARAGGSWFVVRENGTVLVLLNGAWTSHRSQPPYRKSRGLILLELADGDSSLQRFDTLDLGGIEPFTLVIREEGLLYECRWDGSEKYRRQPDAAAPHIWSSVTLYGPEVIRRREEWFSRWLRQHPEPDQEAILHFHQFTGDGDRHNDLLMNRDNVMMTVSITALRAGDSEARLQYLDLPQRRTSRTRLSFTQTTGRTV